MNRWKSPQAAAKKSERALKEAARGRKEKRRSLVLIAGIAVVSVGLTVADYFWMRSQARQKHQRHHHSFKPQTNELKQLPQETNRISF